jgi:iron complex outermembrane receptor protein
MLVTGPLTKLPGGDLTLSFGGDARKQEFSATVLANTGLTPLDTRTDRDRSIQSGFAELQVPIVGPSNRFRGVEALSVSLAERYESYSDFGQSLAARFGLSWAPMRGVTVRSSYSESYRPPGLLDLDESRNAYTYANGVLTDPSTGRPTNVLIWSGKNRDLSEETARSWTAGLEFEPADHPDAAFAITYFSTEFTNRLGTPAFSTDLLSNPALAPLVTRNPSAEYRADVCSRAPQGSGTVGCLTAPVGAIVDLRFRNDAVVRTQGVDVLARYDLLSKAGRFSFALNGTYISDFDEARAANMPLVNEVSTQNHPLNLKMRGSVRWRFGAFDVSGFVNYYNHYEDDTVTPARHVSSWNTFDLHAAYTLQTVSPSWLSETTFVLGADNLFDKDPPFLNNSAASLGYDQENGDLVGRMVNFTVRKKW